MTPSQYQSTWTGKEIPNNSGGFIGECVSAVARFAQEVQGVPDADNVFYCQNTGGARDLWETPTALLLTFYDKVSGPPQLYDIGVWGINEGKYGDTQIYWGNNQQFGQYGTPVFLPAEIRPLNASPLGYLRLKENSMPIVNPDGSPATQAGYNDLLKWKAIGQQLSYSRIYPAMGGSSGNPDADPAQVQPIINDLESYGDFVKGSPAWQSNGGDLTKLEVVAKGTTGTVLVPGTYIVQ